MRLLNFTFVSAFIITSAVTFAQNENSSAAPNAINTITSGNELIISLQKELQNDSLNTAQWLMLGNAWEMQLNFDSAATAYHNAVLS
ncbi:MAG: hypothetical protein PHE03_08495, partial [Bacteroidales bacterium]|nr:hypothetical protein [Bacteroidales bacterium]